MKFKLACLPTPLVLLNTVFCFLFLLFCLVFTQTPASNLHNIGKTARSSSLAIPVIQYAGLSYGSSARRRRGYEIQIHNLPLSITWRAPAVRATISSREPERTPSPSVFSLNTQYFISLNFFLSLILITLQGSIGEPRKQVRLDGNFLLFFSFFFRPWNNSHPQGVVPVLLRAVRRVVMRPESTNRATSFRFLVKIK